MEPEQPLEERIKRDPWLPVKVVVPGYLFKVWNDDRKRYPNRDLIWGTPGLIDAVEIELYRAVGYLVAGAIAYELLK